MKDRPIEILLVEDNPVDARILESYFGESPTKYRLHVVRSGEGALSFLYHGVEYTDAPRPDIVLLDLHLPEMTGFEVLAAVKQHEHLNDIPVIILTGSTSQDDVRKAYSLQASCYLTKPRNREGFVELVEAIDQFWLQLVVLPKR